MVICQGMNQTTTKKKKKEKEIRNLTSSFYRLGAIYDPNVPFVDRNGGGGEKSRTRKNFYFHWVGADILLVALNC